MANEIYEQTNWGLPTKIWGSIYEDYIGEYWSKAETTWKQIVSFWN